MPAAFSSGLPHSTHTASLLNTPHRAHHSVLSSCARAPSIRHHQVTSQHTYIKLSINLRLNRRFTPLQQKPSSIRTILFLLLPPRSAHITPPRTLTHTLLRNHAAPLLTHKRNRIGSGYHPFHFPIPPVRSVRRNTFLSGCLPPWPPSNCLNRRKQFRHAHLGPLSLIKVHSSSHTMLTTVCPLATLFNNTFRVRLPYTRSLYCIAHSRRRCP
jgi:hypothetical protein